MSSKDHPSMNCPSNTPTTSAPSINTISLISLSILSLCSWWYWHCIIICLASSYAACSHRIHMRAPKGALLSLQSSYLRRLAWQSNFTIVSHCLIYAWLKSEMTHHTEYDGSGLTSLNKSNFSFSVIWSCHSFASYSHAFIHTNFFHSFLLNILPLHILYMSSNKSKWSQYSRICLIELSLSSLLPFTEVHNQCERACKEAFLFRYIRNNQR